MEESEESRIELKPRVRTSGPNMTLFSIDAVLDGDIVASASATQQRVLGHEHKIPALISLAVQAPYAGNGIGAKMLQHFDMYLAALGEPPLTSGVYAASGRPNDQAYRAWQQLCEQRAAAITDEDDHTYKFTMVR